MRSSDIRIREVELEYERHRYRTPIKFGGSVVDSVTLLNARVTATNRRGATARGFGSMPLGSAWSFPSKRIAPQRTLAAMEALAERIAAIAGDYAETKHPFDITDDLEPQYLRAAVETAEELGLPEPIPKLCTLVTASPIDAAIHDAFGKSNGINCYSGYGPKHASRDLSAYLGKEFAGEYADECVAAAARPSMPLYHLVGALDPLFPEEVRNPLHDGIPEALTEWVSAEGLTHIKIKLNGNDLDWDVRRVLEVERAFRASAGSREDHSYSLDFNEQCPNVEYLLEFLARVREGNAGVYERVQYVEQPTSRHLRDTPEQRMHRASRLKPVVIDESLVDYESLLLARELGYSGVALKACKGQTNAVLMAAAARKHGHFLCVQDLTCPGASLVHSAGLAAHIPAVQAIEANARQYVPVANEGWRERFPGLFTVAGGRIRTDELDGLGLGAAPAFAEAAR